MISADFDFQAIEPSGRLGRFIRSVWYARGLSPHGRERILPSSGAVVLLVVGPALRMTEPVAGAAQRQIREIRGAWLSGPHERPIINEPTAETFVYGVSMRAGGISGFVKGSAAMLANRILPLSQIDTTLAPPEKLLAQLEATTPALGVAAVVDWLVEGIQPAHRSNDWLAAIDRLISGEPTTVAEVQEEMEVSRRYFIGQVRARAGLAPKVLQRIARMRRLIDELDARKPIRWPYEAAGAGYADQPHAIREFRVFTGMTPGEYVRRRQVAWGRNLDPGEAANFVPEQIR